MQVPGICFPDPSPAHPYPALEPRTRHRLATCHSALGTRHWFRAAVLACGHPGDHWYQFVVFLLLTYAGGSTNPDVLLDFGASYSPYFRRGEYWRLVMPMFLHVGWLTSSAIVMRYSSWGRFWSASTARGVFLFYTSPPGWAVPRCR